MTAIMLCNRIGVIAPVQREMIFFFFKKKEKKENNKSSVKRYIQKYHAKANSFVF